MGQRSVVDQIASVFTHFVFADNRFWTVAHNWLLSIPAILCTGLCIDNWAYDEGMLSWMRQLRRAQLAYNKPNQSGNDPDTALVYALTNMTQQILRIK